MTRTRWTEWTFWTRVVRMAAAIIGASIALWWLSGDRDPEAAADTYTQSVTITVHDTYDIRGVRFYELRDGKGVGFTIGADGDIALARWLDAMNGQRVLLTLQPHELRRDDR